MSDDIEEPTWDDNAPQQKPTLLEDGDVGGSWKDAWDAATGQNSPSANSSSNQGGLLHNAVDGYRNPGRDSSTNNGPTSGTNILKSVGAPAALVQNTASNIGKIDGLLDFDGYSNLVTGLAGDISSVQGVAGEFWSMVEGITDPKGDPVQWLAGTIIDFLMQVFQPLEDLVGMVSGNETRMKDSASMWNSVSAGAPQVADYVAGIGEQNLADWTGGDGDAARLRVAEAGEAIRGMGFIAVGLEGLLGCMADLAKALRQDIVDLLAKGVSWALTRLLPQVAASVATFGASIATAIADAIYKVTSLLSKAISRIRQATSIFEKAATAIQKINEIITKLKPVLDFLKNHKNAINTVGGLAEQQWGR